MNKTKTSNAETRIAVSAETLASMLDCGRATAVKIGTLSGARVQIGKRVIFKIEKIEKYLDDMAAAQG